MTTFEHAIRLLRSDIKRMEEGPVYSYENKPGIAERKAKRLEILKQELAGLRKLSCEHINNETVTVGGDETITVCHDCGDEL